MSAEKDVFSFKKNIIIIVIAAVLALGVGGTVVGVSVYNLPSNRISHYLGAAERYLSEMNYEQAIIEFQNILEIEPMNVDAYLGLAEAYTGLGFTEKALEVLREGLEMTGDSRLQDRIDELTKPEEPVEESKPEYGSMGSVTILGKEYDIATTTILNLEDREITNEDLKQIGKLINLKLLDLENNQISDITPLAGLTNLTSLNLGINDISDITPLAGLTNLTDLDLRFNFQISNLKPLAGLTNLTHLILLGNDISDISPLAGLTNLTYLELHYNLIRNIKPLAGLTNLESLGLSGNYNIRGADEAWLKEQLPNCEFY